MFAFMSTKQDCLFLKRDDNAADCHKDQDAFEIEAEHAEKEISGCRVKFKGGHIWVATLGRGSVNEQSKSIVDAPMVL